MTPMMPQPVLPNFDLNTQYVPPRMNNIVSHVAGVVAAPVKGENALDRAAGLPLTDWAIRFGESGVPVPVLGPFSYVAGVPLSLEVARRDFKLGLEEITNEYRGDIAEFLHIPPQAVTPQMTLVAAKYMPGIRESIQALTEKKEKHPYQNAFGLTGLASGMFAGTGLATALALSGPAGWLVGGGVALAGGMIGDQVGKNWMGDTDQFIPMNHIKQIKEKRQNGEAILLDDIFNLRMAMNPELNKIVEQQYGKNFFQLPGEKKHEVMRKCEGLTRACMADAAKCALPETNVNALMFGPIQDRPVAALARPQQGAWAQRVGGYQPQRQGSFAQMVQASRQSQAVSLQ